MSIVLFQVTVLVITIFTYGIDLRMHSIFWIIVDIPCMWNYVRLFIFVVLLILLLRKTNVLNPPVSPKCGVCLIHFNLVEILFNW